MRIIVSAAAAGRGFSMVALSLAACGAAPGDGNASESKSPDEATREEGAALTTPPPKEDALPATSCRARCVQETDGDSHNLRVCYCRCANGTNCGLYD